MDLDPVRETVIGTLAEELRPAAIIERVDPRIRELEQLPPRQDQVVFAAGESAPKTSTVFSMNGVSFHYDALAGQKSGAFLDQRENYAAPNATARGRALDLFTYQGGFALHLNRVCEQVTAVDASLPALQVAEQNAALNGGREIEWIEANAFDLLRDYADAGRQYETIVLDPTGLRQKPAHAGDRHARLQRTQSAGDEDASPGRCALTCSCSFHVAEAEFLEMLLQAANDAHREVRILEKTGPGQGSSRAARGPGNRVSEVRDLPDAVKFAS